MSLRKVVLEVERKFSKLSIFPLNTHAGVPPFKSLAYLGTKTFRDIYYDRDSKLSKAGTWVRQRDDIWEGKMKQAGDYNRSQFREVQDHELIRKQVALLTGISGPASLAFGLRQTADLANQRQSWLADDKFKIVLDQNDFDHTVGEVELETVIDGNQVERSQEICKQMDQDIDAFIQKYSWAFDTSPAIGKLTAYFAQQGTFHPILSARPFVRPLPAHQST